MDITTQITNLIESVKAQPNSIARNKTMSHLQDARVWSKELDDKFRGISDQENQNKQRGCTCNGNMVRRGCPIHDKK